MVFLAKVNCFAAYYTEGGGGTTSVSDPYTFYTDPDPGIFPNTDPDPAPDPGKKHNFSKGALKNSAQTSEFL